MFTNDLVSTEDLNFKRSNDEVDVFRKTERLQFPESTDSEAARDRGRPIYKVSHSGLVLEDLCGPALG
jgi:hypothetical protein